jgi:hypothetical protein
VNERLRKLDPGDDQRPGIALAAGGIVVVVLGSVFHSRVVRALGFLAAAGGAGLYARARLAKRSEKIDAAESHIRSQLDDLDPIAKAQVIAKLTESPPE